MNYTSFLRGLVDEGRVTVAPLVPLEEDALRAGDQVLAEFDARYRLDWPGEAPEFDGLIARRAAVAFYRACQFLVFRDLGAEAIAKELGTLPKENSPAAHYSVDLTWRLLPDLVRLAQTASSDDPLVQHLLAWGRRWPLSSVGVRQLDAVDPAPLLAHDSLRQMYLDRIFALGDARRLADPAVRELARYAVGAHPELAGALSATLTADDTAESPPEPGP